MTTEAPIATLPQSDTAPALLPTALATADPGRLAPHQAAGYLMLGSDVWDRLIVQCEYMIQGGALHKSIDTPAKAARVAMKGLEMGLPLSSAWEGMRIIEGEICVLGRLGYRMIQERALAQGATCRPIPVAKDEQRKRAGWLMGRPNEDPEEYWFTIEDAEAAGLLMIHKKGGGGSFPSPAWKNYPQFMLRWRSFAYGGAFVFQDVLQGCYIAEEMSHKDPEWINAQAVEAGEEPPARPELSFSAQRVELGDDDEAFVELGTGVRTIAGRYTRIEDMGRQLAGSEPMSEEQRKEAYDERVAKHWDELREGRVGGRRPTTAEAGGMQTILDKWLSASKREFESTTKKFDALQKEPEQGPEDG